MIKTMSCALAATMCMLVSTSSAQTRFSDPKKTLDEEFWGKLYKDGGETFFCKKAFTKKSILVTESYIYSISWIRDELGCGTPRQCRDNDPKYQNIASDLHNIYPADARIELERRNARFEDLPDSVVAGNCGIKRSFQIIEPPSDTKGDIARIIFYMHETYQLPIMGDINQLKSWSKMDPPSEAEIQRNLKVLELQGNDNMFISHPEDVDKISR